MNKRIVQKGEEIRVLQIYALTAFLHGVSGRRKVQCRLVEPSAASINSGDCYVLVTADKLYLWSGEYCNVIEKAKVGVGDRKY